jgi:hypothetical protein
MVWLAQPQNLRFSSFLLSQHHPMKTSLYTTSWSYYFAGSTKNEIVNNKILQNKSQYKIYDHKVQII